MNENGNAQMIQTSSTLPAMTYRELLAQLQQLTDEQLDSTATVYDTDSDEYYGCTELVYTTEWQDVLDPNHPVIRF